MYFGNTWFKSTHSSSVKSTAILCECDPACTFFVGNSGWFPCFPCCRCGIYYYWKLGCPAFFPSILFLKEWDSFWKFPSYISMNREHNTGGDELGGVLETGIAFFGCSWEENSCINHFSLLFFGGGVGGSRVGWGGKSRGISPDAQNSSCLQLRTNSLAQAGVPVHMCVTVPIISQQKTAVYISNESTLK